MKTELTMPGKLLQLEACVLSVSQHSVCPTGTGRRQYSTDNFKESCSILILLSWTVAVKRNHLADILSGQATMTYSLRLAIIMCNIEELEALPAGTQLTKKSQQRNHGGKR